jgi:EAL domain-containing protein (putative c-di-GMP-specific phosphodiesterase class I)
VSSDLNRWLPGLADVLPNVSRDFSDRGALGLVLLDAGPLRPVERSFGTAVLDAVMADLAHMVRSVAEDAFGEQAVLCEGETGRCEIVVMITSDHDDVDFYTKRLPTLQIQLRDRLERQGQRIGYPYVRPTPRLSIGAALALRNPHNGIGTEVADLLLEARSDADLDGRIASRARRRRLMELITGGRVYSVYEPIVDASNLTVFGYEALARGMGDSDLSAPLVLFGLAEEEGLTFQLDCLCRTKAIEGAVDFPSGAKLFINIRPSSFHDPAFQPDALKRTLEHCGLGPTDVVFEISEQESISNYDALREKRDAYGAQGFQFALDDTGAGYACLEAVMKLSPEFIKVDRAFVSGIDEDASRQAMVAAFCSIAERTNARIIGEGLDTLEELQTLGSMGIPFGQGWLFGKAHPLRASG